MPPGPPGLPLFGNAFQMGSFQWLKFAEWKEQYGLFTPTVNAFLASMSAILPGPIFSLNVAGQHAVVLSDFETATELMSTISLI